MRTILVWSGCGLLLFSAGFLAGRATSPLAALGQSDLLARSITRAIPDPENSNPNGDPGDSIGIGHATMHNIGANGRGGRRQGYP